MPAKKKATTRKTTARKATTKKTTVKKTTARKPAAKKTTAKKTAVRKPAAKKTVKKTTVKKTAVRKPAAKKTTAKKATVKKTTAIRTSVPSIKKPLTQSELFTHIADMTGLSKSDVKAVYQALTDITEASLKKRGPREFTMPGMAKFTVVRKPARKARKGINPFTGEEMMFKAKPAQDVVKARLLKKLKEMAA